MIIFCCLLIALAAGAPARAVEAVNDRPEVVTAYERGKLEMSRAEWQEAQATFAHLAEQFPQSPNRDLFAFNQAKALYHLGEYPRAIAVFGVCIDQFPSSSVVPSAHYFRANAHYQLGQLDRALAGYIQSFGLSTEPRLSDLVLASLSSAIAAASSVNIVPGDIDGLESDKRCQLAQHLATALFDRNETISANQLLQICARSSDRKSRRPGDSFKNRTMEIAILLPFSGEMQSFGEEIYGGVLIAAESFRRKTGQALEVTAHDTQGDPINAARLVKQLARSSVDAVIGPLTSEEAAVASAALGCEPLAMIAPAATQAGLTELSDGAFQLSPNVELQGIRMAEHAALVLGADSAAIITSTNSEHLRMARGFTNRFEQLGGQVIAVEYYRTRDKDFGRYIRDIKAELQGRHPDSMFFINEYGDTLDGDGLPARIDCLFVPGKSNQLRQLLPQIDFYNLEGALLGSDGWADDAIYRLGERVAGRAVFPSPFLQRHDRARYLEFATAYDRRYGKQPQRLASLGYDAVSLLAEALRAGAKDRAGLIEHLAEIRNYDGAAASLSFGAYRENIEMPLYRIENGVAVPLASPNTPDETKQ